MISMLLGLLLAPLLAGVINRVKAFFAGRRGRPLFQLYWDLARLVRKHMVLSRTTTPVFLLGPALSLASLVTCLALLPLGGPALLLFPGDLLVLLGLLGLVRFATVLAAMDTGSSFEGMGASREVAIGALAEPGMFLALAVLVVQTRVVSLSELWAHRGLDLWNSAGLVLALVGVALFLLLLAESCRIPVDDPNTHLASEGKSYYVLAGKDPADEANWIADTMAGWHSATDPNAGKDMENYYAGLLEEAQAQTESMQSYYAAQLAALEEDRANAAAEQASLEAKEKRRRYLAALGRSGTMTTGGEGSFNTSATLKTKLGA